MKLNDKKLIPYLIVIVPLILVLSVSAFITTFYLNKVTDYFAQAKVNSIADYIDTKKSESELWINQLVLLFEYTNNLLEPRIEKELKVEVDLAYKVAHRIYEKHKNSKSKREIKQRIKDALGELVFNNKEAYIFIKDFNANTLLNSQVDEQNLEHRDITLEEIQKVAKRKQGYLKYTNTTNEKKMIYVKNLNIYGWFIGSSANFETQREKLKNNLLTMVKSAPIDKVEFMGVFSGNKTLYLTEKLKLKAENFTKDSQWHQHQLKGYYYFSRYYAPFNWYVVYGFSTKSMSVKAKNKHDKLEEILSKELTFILKVSAFIIIFIVILSLLLSFKINKIFKSYHEEVELKRRELEELNNSLQTRVDKEVKAHREKDKMLTQQTKMAEMGDMLSMIAHQWRQPLNQMSYVFMNIDSAFEYKELTQEYLDSKIKEGNELLEFMSVTIDDFRNFFRPDKDRVTLKIEDAINNALTLIEKTLDRNSIVLEFDFQADREVSIYRNEFIQVMLNLIKNSKDILIQEKIKEPKIVISTQIKDTKVLITVCDNGKGIDESIKEKIFEPYFSTKDEKNGTGLGLYMSRVIIQDHHGGVLSVQNSEQGACFKIELPM